MIKINFIRWLGRTNHKDIGMIYFVFGIFSGIVGAILSLIIRAELRNRNYNLIRENSYNVAITAHGLIMIFFFVIPILMGGFGNFLIPLMMGCGDMAFPRINNLSF